VVSHCDDEHRPADEPKQPLHHRRKCFVADQVEFRKLTREELDELAGEALPERAAMSLINANVAAPVNLAAALNVLSDNSIAIANAQQTAPITQST
jgi:hypothetical protein